MNFKLAAQLVDIARKNKTILTTAESCTGGMLAQMITAVPGASEVFERGVITYSNATKQQMLGVDGAVITRFGAVSEEVARQMAKGAQLRANADLAVSITGVAGPGASASKPEGRVCFALATADDLQSETVEFGALGRQNVRKSAAHHALQMCCRRLSQEAGLSGRP